SGRFQRWISWRFLIAFVYIIIYSCVGIPWLRSGEILPGNYSWIDHNIKKSVQIFFICEFSCVLGFLKWSFSEMDFLEFSYCVCVYYNLFMYGDTLAYTWCNITRKLLLD